MAPTPPPNGSPGVPDGLDLSKLALDQTKRGADQLITAGMGGWWSRTDENQRRAMAGLLAAVTIGPLGQGLLAALGVLFGKAALPSSDQLLAVVWLTIIAAPVVVWCFTAIALAGKASVPVTLIVAGAAAYAGGMFLASQGIPAQLGDLYCYASLNSSGIEYEKACRAFDALGFLAKTAPLVGSPSRSPEIAQWAFVFTADARGSVMAFAAAIAGFCSGYLVRRSTG